MIALAAALGALLVGVVGWALNERTRRLRGERDAAIAKARAETDAAVADVERLRDIEVSDADRDFTEAERQELLAWLNKHNGGKTP